MSEVGMLKAHRVLIQKNFKNLVENCDIQTLIPKLLQKNVFSEQMVKRYRTEDELENKRRLFLDIDTRGPDAFHDLIDSLRETGQNKLANDLSPKKERSVKKHAQMFQMPTNAESEVLDLEDDSITPLTINVVKAEKFYDLDDAHFYRTRSRRRGQVLIVNNIHFADNDRNPVRRGAGVDGANLLELFKQMNMEVTYYEDKEAEEIEMIVNNFSKRKELGTSDIAIFVFMSHGFLTPMNESMVKGTDGVGVKTLWIEQQFNNKNCKFLHNKPKVFIYQICRNNESNDVESDSTPNFTPSIHNNTRHYTDMLIAHSTLPGFTSHRDIFRGTWYIEILCEVFMKHAHEETIDNLLKMVDVKLAKLQSAIGTVQTSTYQVVAFRNCYIHPGIYEENEVIKYFSENNS